MAGATAAAMAKAQAIASTTATVTVMARLIDRNMTRATAAITST